jgi:hypothetical protein
MNAIGDVSSTVTAPAGECKLSVSYMEPVDPALNDVWIDSALGKMQRFTGVVWEDFHGEPILANTLIWDVDTASWIPGVPRIVAPGGVEYELTVSDLGVLGATPV